MIEGRAVLNDLTPSGRSTTQQGWANHGGSHHQSYVVQIEANRAGNHHHDRSLEREGSGLRNVGFGILAQTQFWCLKAKFQIPPVCSVMFVLNHDCIASRPHLSGS